jgi:magnesium transporter
MEAVSELGPEVGATLLATRSAEDIARLAQEIPSDDAAALIDNLPEELSAAVLDLMRPKESGVVENLLEYAERTAGRIMNPQVFALAEDLTVGEAITELQQNREVEMVFYLYVVDDRRHLVGVVSLRRLLLVSPETPLKRIMSSDLVSARVDTDQEEGGAAGGRLQPARDPGRGRGEQAGRQHHRRRRHRRHQGRGHRGHLPAGGRGRRRARVHPGRGVAPQAAAVAGGQSRHRLRGRRRRGALRGHDWTLPVLAIFMPIVAGMGGNAGTQTLTVVVRGIALGELTWTNARKALLKETLVGHWQRRGAGAPGRAGRVGHARQPGARQSCSAWR